MEVSQILALLIFVAMFAAIIHGGVHRFIPALAGAALVILLVFLYAMRSPDAVLNVLNLGHFFQPAFWIPGQDHLEVSRGINWQTIVFIAGMMVLVEGLVIAGFFRWLCLVVARLVNYRVVPIFVTFVLLSGIMAMFIDSITVLLFLASVTIELSRLLTFDPVPVIIAEIFAANVGGAATMSGDPPNMIIGTAFGFTFMDFIANTGIIACIVLAGSMIFFYFAFKDQLVASHGRTRDPAHFPEPCEAIPSMMEFYVNTAVFIFVIVLLVTHARTGLSVALIGVIAAVLTLCTHRSASRALIKGMDWKTLLFFIGLFIVVGGMEETGVLAMLARFIGNISGGNPILTITLILWFSAFASALVDNIPFSATMVPVIRDLAMSQGMSLQTLSWSLALGTDIGGNGTPIGASANVVGTAIAEKEGYPISWGRFMKYALPAMILAVGLCNLYLLLRYT